MNGEFALIERYFARPAPEGVLGVGDDCALLTTCQSASLVFQDEVKRGSPHQEPQAPPNRGGEAPTERSEFFTPACGQRLAVSSDMLVEGQHFFADVDPAALGHKALAVNLSDLAAMGATPMACLLSLALPCMDDAWLAPFAQSLHALAQACRCPLVGGDTVRSPHGIVINITVLGQVPPDTALRRDAARVGDDVWVSGELGAADIALRLLQGRLPADAALLAHTRRALEWPEAQLALGQALLGVAHAAIDVSDGLSQDLGHILTASACGAVLEEAAVPVAANLHTLPQAIQREAALTGGDGYQLCFTAAAENRAAVRARAAAVGARVTRIGVITAQPGLQIVTSDGADISVVRGGFDHFSSPP